MDQVITWQNWPIAIIVILSVCWSISEKKLKLFRAGYYHKKLGPDKTGTYITIIQGVLSLFIFGTIILAFFLYGWKISLVSLIVAFAVAAALENLHKINPQQQHHLAADKINTRTSKSLPDSDGEKKDNSALIEENEKVRLLQEFIAKQSQEKLSYDDQMAAIRQEVANHWEKNRPKWTARMKRSGLFDQLVGVAQIAMYAYRMAIDSYMSQHYDFYEAAEEIDHWTWNYFPDSDDGNEVIEAIEEIYEDPLDAEKIARCISHKIIASLQQLTDRLFDESELKTTWDKICVQIQDAEAQNWGVYYGIMRFTSLPFIRELSNQERKLLWLRTDRGCCTIVDDEDDEADPEDYDEDISDYLINYHVFPKAENWTNPRIRSYLEWLRGK